MFLLLFMIVEVLGQSKIQLLNQLYKLQLAGLNDFSTQYINFSIDNRLLVFGGKVNNQAKNWLLQINMSNQPYIVANLTKNSSEIAINARYKHCSLVVGYKMYIYGGFGSQNQTLNDLWEYNWKVDSWNRIGTTSSSYQKCSMVYFNELIYIFVVTNQSLMLIYEVHLSLANVNYQFAKVEYKYANSVVIQSKIWLNTTKQYSVLIESSPISLEALGYFGTLNYTNILSAKQIFAFPYSSAQIFLLVTEDKICSINMTSMSVEMLRTYKNIQFNVGIVYTKQWLFFIDADSDGIFCKYFGGSEFKIQGILSYSNLQSSQYKYHLFTIGYNLYLISLASLNTWIIRKDCKTISNPNIINCFYEKVHCKQGYRGQNCSDLACPNSLSLFDNVTNQILLYECSNHGNCINSKCVCKDNWLGVDCSQYNRTNCQSNGEIVQNWPIMNCQCKSETIGGNSCEVKFCYNDCSNHGTCEKNGKCSCKSGFFGEDCSITIIKFPGSTFFLQN